MTRNKREATDASTVQRQPYRVHLPGFIRDQDVGLGDVIQRATYAVGIRSCGGCAQRAAKLNSLVRFSGRHRT